MASAQREAPLKAQGKRNPHIIILDADQGVLNYLRRILSDRFQLTLFSEVTELSEGLKVSGAPDLLLMDWHIGEGASDENALGLLARVHGSHPKLPIIMLACTAEIKEVVEATRMGAADVILKPFKKSDIDQAVEKCLKEPVKLAADDDVKEIPLDENTSFVRSSKRMREIEQQCVLVARADLPVLVLGESGTGKEVAAMLIHKMSGRSKRTFLKVNCAAMPADLLESELFGYEQGAFTGALKAKPGKFEICNGGTIFLDEIGEMPNALQAKLLQVLQDGTFSRLGSRSPMKVDVRVIAATNINMKEAMANKTFREDLYYRLNGFTLSIPPLRERKDEIPVLSEYFMRKGAKKYGRDVLSFSTNLMDALVAHHWPGNLRELENVVNRYLVLGDEKAILDELTPHDNVETASGTAEAPSGSGLKAMVRNLKGEAESTAIAQVLEETGWNRKAAANDLQISYKALLYKIKQYDLSPQDRA